EKMLIFCLCVLCVLGGSLVLLRAIRRSYVNENRWIWDWISARRDGMAEGSEGAGEVGQAGGVRGAGSGEGDERRCCDAEGEWAATGVGRSHRFWEHLGKRFRQAQRGDSTECRLRERGGGLGSQGDVHLHHS